MSGPVVIVGGGIVGLSAAYELLRRGRSVVLLEKGPADHDSCSLGNAGMIVPSHFVPLAAPPPPSPVVASLDPLPPDPPAWNGTPPPDHEDDGNNLRPSGCHGLQHGDAGPHYATRQTTMIADASRHSAASYGFTKYPIGGLPVVFS